MRGEANYGCRDPPSGLGGGSVCKHQEQNIIADKRSKGKDGGSGTRGLQARMRGSAVGGRPVICSILCLQAS